MGCYCAGWLEKDDIQFRGCLKIELLKQKSYRLKLKSEKSPGFSHIIKIDES